MHNRLNQTTFTSMQCRHLMLGCHKLKLASYVRPGTRKSVNTRISQSGSNDVYLYLKLHYLVFKTIKRMQWKQISSKITLSFWSIFFHNYIRVIIPIMTLVITRDVPNHREHWMARLSDGWLKVDDHSRSNNAVMMCWPSMAIQGTILRMANPAEKDTK